MLFKLYTYKQYVLINVIAVQVFGLFVMKIQPTGQVSWDIMLQLHMHILNKEACLQGAGTVTQQKKYSQTWNLMIMRKPTCKWGILVHYGDTFRQAAGEWHLFKNNNHLTNSIKFPQKMNSMQYITLTVWSNICFSKYYNSIESIDR